MKVKVNKRAKDLAAIPSRDREKIETFLFTELEAFHSIADIGGMEKLTGYAMCSIGKDSAIIEWGCVMKTES